MEINTAEKIRLLSKRKNFSFADIAEGTGQTRQNFSNKIKRGDFKESELLAIAEVLNCTIKISFVDKDTGEEI